MVRGGGLFFAQEACLHRLVGRERQAVLRRGHLVPPATTASSASVAKWTGKSGSAPATTCFSHRTKGGAIYQKREPSGDWYLFKHARTRSSDEYAKFRSGDLVAGRLAKVKTRLGAKSESSAQQAARPTGRAAAGFSVRLKGGGSSRICGRNRLACRSTALARDSGPGGTERSPAAALPAGRWRMRRAAAAATDRLQRPAAEPGVSAVSVAAVQPPVSMTLSAPAAASDGQLNSSVSCGRQRPSLCSER